jgi:hypothetical protein
MTGSVGTSGSVCATGSTDASATPRPPERANDPTRTHTAAVTTGEATPRPARQAEETGYDRQIGSVAPRGAGRAEGTEGNGRSGAAGGAGEATPCPPVQADETARFPSPPLRRWITARDTTCRAPGCTAPARSSDIDHTKDHAEGGRTRHDNLGLVCRHHHRLKHEGGFELDQPMPGTFVWTSPSGKSYTTDADSPW